MVESGGKDEDWKDSGGGEEVVRVMKGKSGA